MLNSPDCAQHKLPSVSVEKRETERKTGKDRERGNRSKGSRKKSGKSFLTEFLAFISAYENHIAWN